MPKNLTRFTSFSTLFFILFTLVSPFLSTPVQAASELCSNSAQYDKPIMTITPNRRVIQGTAQTLHVEYKVSKDDSKAEGKPNAPFSWEIWQSTNSFPKKSPYLINGAPARITLQSVREEKTENGNVVTYSGDSALHAGGILGDHKLYLLNPLLAQDDVKTRFTCSKTVSYHVIDPNQDAPIVNTYKALDDCSPVAFGFSSCPTLSQFTNIIISLVLGTIGGVAFLLLIYGGLRLISSQGDAKALQEARGIITAAIMGLLFAVFSIFLLRLIGINLLGLPI